MIRVALYDAKAYDKPSFEHYSELHNIRLRFLETKLNEDTVDLANAVLFRMKWVRFLETWNYSEHLHRPRSYFNVFFYYLSSASF